MMDEWFGLFGSRYLRSLHNGSDQYIESSETFTSYDVMIQKLRLG